MADNDKPLDGGAGNADAETVKLQKQIDELKASLSGKDGQIADLEAIKAQLVDARNALKKKEDEALAEQGKYKDLYEKALAELDAIKSESGSTKTELEQARTRLAEIEEAERTRLLELLPDGDREEFKDFSVEALQKIVKVAGHNQPAPGFNGRPSSPPRKGDPKKWSEMTMAERDDYTRTHSQEELFEKIKEG